MATPQFLKSVGGPKRDAFIDRIHAHAPNYWDSSGFWVISRYGDVRCLLRNHASLSSATTQEGYPLLTDDPPRHSALRGFVHKAFTPAGIAARRPVIEANARALVAQIPAGKEVDAIDALAARLPMRVIAQILGIPQRDGECFKRWSAIVVGREGTGSRQEWAEASSELRALLAGILQRRRSAPRTDLITLLAQPSEQGVCLCDADVVGLAVLLLAAGIETTTHLLGNCLHRLASSPSTWERLRSSPDTVSDVVEETLRLDCPVQFLVRQAVEEIQVDGQAISAGAKVVLYLAAANRDPNVWDRPNKFDPSRERKRHLAFGHGIHHCIGAPLARLETEIALLTLAVRFTSLAPGSSQGARTGSGLMFGFGRLPLIFT